MKVKSLLTLIALNLLALSAEAQPPKVLKGSEITESALIDALSEEPIRSRSIRVKRDQADAAGKVSMLITFHTNSADLTSDARQSLDVVGRALNMDKLADRDFTIEGHADPRGGAEYNQRLSQARAETVRDYLVRNHNIDEDRLAAIGKGDHELLDKENPTAPENRRVTIVRKSK